MTTSTFKKSCAALSALFGMTVSASTFAGRPSQALLDFVAKAAALSVTQDAGAIGPVRDTEVGPVADPVVPIISPTIITPTVINPTITPGGNTNLLPPVRPPFRPTIRSPFTP